MYVVDNGYQL